MAHVKGWATPEDYSGEDSVVSVYSKVVVQKTLLKNGRKANWPSFSD
jgi:hypothetical protein